MKIKVCGMRENIEAVASLSPDYMGFIFWEPSSRFLGNTAIPTLPPQTKKVGVFVDEGADTIQTACVEHGLQMVQLHGKETPAFCQALREKLEGIQVIKAFAVDEAFDFRQLQAYEKACDFFLFDTKGKLPGGNSKQFNWSLLGGYPSSKPYFLSGGIGPGDLDDLQEFRMRPEAEHCIAVDVNSKFETAPGRKDTSALTNFMTRIKKREQKRDR